MRSDRDRSARRSAIGVATGAYGVSFGVLAVAAGLSVAQACAMSLLVFTGASQFAFVGVLGAGGSVAAALAPGAAARGAQRASTACRWRRSCAAARGRARSQAQLVIDESTAMARAQDDPRARAPRVPGHRPQRLRLLERSARSRARCSAAASATRASLGLDAMFPAAFLALLAPQLRRPGRAGRRRSAAR